MTKLNKKLAVLLVVPILIAMGGTFAFSAFSGGSSTAINSTAGHLTWENNLTLVRTNANNTPITIQGPSGQIYEIGQGMQYHHNSGHYTIGLGNQFYTTATSGREYVVNVTNMAPGEYVELMATITNNGTVGFMVSPAAPTFSPAVNSTHNATQASQGKFASVLQSSNGYVYNVTAVSGFNTSISPEGSAVMLIYIGLGNDNGHDLNHYQGSHFSLNVNLNVVSDP